MRHLQGMQERGHECAVITAHGRADAPGVLDFGGIPVYRFPIASAIQNGDLRGLLVIQREIQRIKQTFLPDVEHLNFGGPTPIGFVYLRTAAIATAPLIIALHGSVLGLDGSADSITSRILSSAAWTTACSEAMLEDARLVLPAIAERSSVVHPGCSETQTPPKPLPFDEVRILCLGRLVSEKGIDIAIRAFSQVIQDHPRARLIIAGDGPARPMLERQAAELGLGGMVNFIGTIEPHDVYGLINTTTLMVIPSRWREAFGLVALEAAQMARPVVASRVGGLPEAVLDGQTGLLFPNEDAPALAKCINSLLDNPELATRMGQNGRARVLSKFRWQQYLDAYESLYCQQTQTDANEDHA